MKHEKPSLPQSDVKEIKRLDSTPEMNAIPPLAADPLPDQPPPATSRGLAEPSPSHPNQSLGDLYAAIDAAPAEWLPSVLAKVVKTSLKSGAWSDVENLILSVRGFSK